MSLSFFILSLSVCLCACEKRLLLTDPDVVQSLQNELHTLRSKVQQLESSQNNAISENAALKSKVQQLESSQNIAISENAALKSKLTRLEDELANLRQTVVPAVSSYIIWGRKTCPQVNGTKLLYSGLIAGKIYSEIGSGVNTLCLPHDPDSAPSDFPTSVSGGSPANVWGAEYQFNYRHIAVNDDPPCAVCQVQRSTTLMIPAKRNCPVGWVKEYTGMLVGASEDEYASDYICLDENPEFFEGTRSHNDNGRTLFPVRARCGSLPCPPFIDYHYISCLVCSQ